LENVDEADRALDVVTLTDAQLRLAFYFQTQGNPFMRTQRNPFVDALAHRSYSREI